LSNSVVLANKIFEYQGKIYIFANHNKLISYDPSTGNDTLVASDIRLQSVYVANNKIYFAKHDSTYGTELWEYDGSTAPTRITDLKTSGDGNSNPTRVTEVNGDIVFQATPDGNSNHLYKWDGTTITPLN
jgi:ELWxxDGT repeat protein